MVFNQHKIQFGIIVCFLVGFSSLVKGQDKQIATRADTAFVQQVGFTDLSNIKEVMKYRLPSWGYSVFSVGGNLNGSATNTFYELDGLGESDVNNYINVFELVPYYKKYQESELRVSTIEFSSKVTGDFQKQTREYRESSFSTPDRDTRETRFFTISSMYEMSNIKYKSEDENEFSGWGTNIKNEYRAQYQKIDFMFDNIQKFENYLNEFNLGVYYISGKGRLRNVTPLFSALRFLERSKHIGKSISNDKETIQKVAQQFVKQDAYTANVLSRPNKYFWDDLIREAGLENQLSAFELNYLQETSIELMGERFQGFRFEFQPGILLNRVDYFPDENEFEEDYSHNNLIGIGLNFNALIKYSNNPNLNQQFQTSAGLTASTIKSRYLDFEHTSDVFIWGITHSSILTNLLADRWVWNNGYNAILIKQSEDDYNRFEGNLTLSSDLAYFFESNTSISLNLKYSYGYFNDNPSYYKHISSQGLNYTFTFKHFFTSTIR